MQDLTEIRKLEEAKFFLASIVETSNDSIITIDFQRNITSWNKAAEHLYGYSAEEAIGKNLTMLTRPEDFVELLAKVDAVEHSREVAVFDTVRHTKDKWVINLEVVMSPVLNTSGEVIGISTIARDVSERKRRESNLAFLARMNLGFAPLLTIQEVMEPVAEQLADYLQLHRCHFSLIDEEADRMEVIYEYRRNESLPSTGNVQHLSDTFTEEGRRRLSAGHLVVINAVPDSPLVNGGANRLKGLGFGLLVYVPHLEGNRWRFLLTAERAEESEWRKDELELLQEVASKIHVRVERAKAEEALRESEKRLQSITDLVPDLLWDIEPDGSTHWYNQRWLEYTGQSFEEAVGWGWMDAIHPDDREASARQYGIAVENGEVLRQEHRIRRYDGEYRWFVINAFPLKDESGQVIKMYGAAADIHVLRLMNEALRESEGRFRSFVLASSDSVYRMSADWQVMHNLEGKTFLANTSSANSSWMDSYIPEHEQPRVGKAIEEAIKNKRIFELEHQVFDTNGKLSWALSRAVPLLAQQDGIAEWIGAATNITDRKFAEEALRQSEARLRTLSNAVPQVIWTNTADGFADYFNQRWYEFSGLTYEQSTGLGWQRIVHPEDGPASVEKWEKALAVGEAFDTEYRLRRQDGSYWWFIGRNVPLRDDQGKITGWFGSATEIEELKKTEEALSQSEARLRITMESATDYGIITMDTNRRVERWSQGAAQLFGFTDTEVTGQLADIIYTQEDKDAGVPQKEMDTARDTGRAADDRWHQRKDGSRFFANGVMRPIKNSVLTGYVKVLRDMTQQQLSTEELHRLVAERTRDLQRSNEDLQQFAHVASHDLKEPVRKVKAFTNRLIDEFEDLLPERAKKYLKKINASTDRMFSMIEGVLAYSLVGKTAISVTPIDLNETIDEIESVLEVMIHRKKATITKRNLPTIKGNPTLIFQLFYNLLLNSMKFSKKDTFPEINLYSESVRQEQTAFAKITLADNGIGFEAEFQEVIFQTFSRLNPMDEYEGTGLGLALCKKIVERHGGQISATGEPGKGAVLTLFLPIH